MLLQALMLLNQQRQRLPYRIKKDAIPAKFLELNANDLSMALMQDSPSVIRFRTHGGGVWNCVEIISKNANSDRVVAMQFAFSRS